MRKDTLTYIKETVISTLLPIFFCGMILLFLSWQNVPYNASFLEITSAVLGISFVLIIRNPNNYLGFPIGILSSLLLSLHFFQINLQATAILYLLFIPLQFYTMINWLRGNKKKGNSLHPSFLTRTNFLYISISIIPLSGLLMLAFRSNTILVSLIECVFVALNILSNILIIRKKTEAWFFWIISNFVGGILFTYKASYFTVLLHLVFIMLNLLALIRWTKETRMEKTSE